MLYSERKWYAEIQQEWLDNVSHQILAPINGIVGQVENLVLSFHKWQRFEPQRIRNTLVNLLELSNWAARMAKNFSWGAKGRNYAPELNLRLEDDVLGKLIGCARNFQGLARNRHLKRVHVEPSIVKKLNNHIVIDSKYFKQAVMNLLDNAVKYADPNTEVIINATVSDKQGLIHITNIGIPITVEDIEIIFERGYRTKAAKEKYAIGSGIGLWIAQDIIRLHGGDVTTVLSVRTETGWKTTFTISLPLIPEIKNE